MTETIQQRRRRYYLANKDAELAKRKAHYTANKEKKKAYQNAYWHANKARLEAEGKLWRQKNRERAVQISIEWAKKNRTKSNSINQDWYYRYTWRALFYSAKNRAKKKSIEFTITPEDIVVPELCPVFKQPFVWGKGQGKSDWSPSLDRIDSTKGYVKGNVAVISTIANKLKSNATLEQLLQLTAYVQAATSPKNA